MLKTLPPFMNADLLWVLAAMGHGDRLAIVDRNYPAYSSAQQTQSGRCIQLQGTSVVEAFRGILQLMPLDTFVATPLHCMDSVDQPGVVLPVQADVLSECVRAEGRNVNMGRLARAEFYEAAQKSFAILHTTESRPYGCFLLTKGVVFDA
ncbi:RbsD/FucU family protein [Rhodoferax sp.]|uniref:RbsD/FucU family protein n=1 Tax=Rhodoferax sp. TaxID=50421 RepID=UPI002ACE8E34|nr:RbsD/FucU domain-containing protein [Rhodoferax sp.]MDZ7919533.1 RbsD/FucU domain-containing protein [Rhodoferax sp.]MDZ7938674.1 RbsD/FucU domain-containing protein [Rhodoferax sp.]